MFLKVLKNLVVKHDVVKITLCDKLDLKIKDIGSKDLKVGALVNKVQ